jgi:phosphatidylglycerophosphate synthase
MSESLLQATRPLPVVPAPLSRLGTVRTIPNAVTLGRTLAAVAVAGVGIATDHPWLLAVAYAIYWIGDMLDGLTARLLDQETRLGAVLDIISDRACTGILCVGLIAWRPALATVAVPFFCSFMVLDTMLSLAFLCWPLLSPNHFARVSVSVYRLNWSPPAKAVNTAGVVLLALTGLWWAALLLTLALVWVKVWSVRRVLQLLASGAVAS